MGRSVALGEGLGALKFHAHGASVAAQCPRRRCFMSDRLVTL